MRYNITARIIAYAMAITGIRITSNGMHPLNQRANGIVRWGFDPYL